MALTSAQTERTVLLALFLCGNAMPIHQAYARGDSEAEHACIGLLGEVWPGAVVTSAEILDQSAPGTIRIHPSFDETVAVRLPARCRIEGVIDGRTGADGKQYGLRFALALPLAWNGRFAYQGGGGFNGVLREPVGPHSGPVPALASGFAVISTDGGHSGAGPIFFGDQQASLDFAFNAVPSVTRLGQYLATQFYRRAPHHSYSVGCSTGGREGMLAAQLYPLLFDGVLAGAPAMNTWTSQVISWNAELAFARAAPRDPESGRMDLRAAFPADDQRLLHAAVLHQCDALDGLADGQVSRPGACQFHPATLVCEGAKTTSCLSAAQVVALETAFAPIPGAVGETTTAGFPWDPGLLGEHVSTIPSLLPSGVPTQFGPPPDAASFEATEYLLRAREHPVSALNDASRWTNLNTFHGSGGRLILWHGAADAWFSMNETVTWFDRMTTANPGADFARFYAVPGVGHCGGGGTDSFDLLTPLVEWVEEGRAPQAITAVSSTRPALARPLCPWPSYARYRGGETDKAESFICSDG